jgi:NAD(P)-dependent dehydrogenase (short-subunit alcohol dehydrogenase family)
MSRIAVVTGAIGGLGTAMIQALAAAGRRPVAIDYTGLKPEAVDKWKADRKAEGLTISRSIWPMSPTLNLALKSARRSKRKSAR